MGNVFANSVTPPQECSLDLLNRCLDKTIQIRSLARQYKCFLGLNAFMINKKKHHANTIDQCDLYILIYAVTECKNGRAMVKYGNRPPVCHRNAAWTC